jgi:predicted ribosome quality control (RQC) complex YloA/Tae2 family protein
MPIRWDSLLARAVAREMDEAFRGMRLRALRLDGRTRDLLLFFRHRTLVWRLHPERGYPLLEQAVEPGPGDHRLRARVRRVYAPPDERIVVFELVGERPGGPGYEVVIELLGTTMNAIVAEGSERTIRHVLRTRDGARPARVGVGWTPPTASARLGATAAVDVEAWVAHLAPGPPPSRERELVRTVAWTSPLNANAFLGAFTTAEDPEALLRVGHARWRAAVHEASSGNPAMLETERGPQPYPFPLPGATSRSVPSLFEAFALCAREEIAAGDAPAVLAVGPELLQQLEQAVAQAERRVVRLEAELAERENPETLRAVGDLILARYAEIRPGSSRVVLRGFDGAPVEVTLDPALPPHQNASSWYDRAGRSERAAQRLPDLIRKARAAHGRVARLLEEAHIGTATAPQIRSALPSSTRVSPRGRDAPEIPYRTFRSSGGLEIRVGRGSRQNDDLTFRHSDPSDVWLHVRQAAGAHVILRWRGPGNPPARDLEEAATLAALHSRARTSGTVPVDWTLRRYVRKPRGAAPGSVRADRVRTIFVRPDPEVAERLAEER